MRQCSQARFSTQGQNWDKASSDNGQQGAGGDAVEGKGAPLRVCFRTVPRRAPASSTGHRVKGRTSWGGSSLRPHHLQTFVQDVCELIGSFRPYAAPACAVSSADLCEAAPTSLQSSTTGLTSTSPKSSVSRRRTVQWLHARSEQKFLFLVTAWPFHGTVNNAGLMLSDRCVGVLEIRSF